MKECPTCRHCFPDEFNNCPSHGEELIRSIAGDIVLDKRYQLDQRLGQGGMGIVFKGRHLFLKTTYAIKVILPDLVGNDPMLVTRFRQEAMVAARIRHRNIVNVTDFGVANGSMPYLVMDLIKGRSLQHVLAERGRFSPEYALEIMTALCAGIGAAHKQEIVHRDLKPLNIMLQDDVPVSEGLKVLDFGLAKIKSSEFLGSFVGAQTTALVGSPFYMAPELWSDEDPDRRVDIYSLGVILFQILANDVPFKGATIPAIMNKHLMMPPPTLASMGVKAPPAIDAVIQHALAKRPEDRLRTVEDFINELRDAVLSAHAGFVPLPTEAMNSQEVIMVLPETESGEIDRGTSSRPGGASQQERTLPDPEERTEHEADRLRQQFDEAQRRTDEACQHAEAAARRRAEEEATWKKAEEEAARKRADEARQLAKDPIDELEIIASEVTPLPSQQESFTVMQGHLTLHMDKQVKTPEHYSATVPLRFSEAFHHSEEHLFEELVLHKDYEQLWRSLIHAGGGCNLLTGYGRFGGTSLVRCAIEKARVELNKTVQGQAALLVFYFSITSEDEQAFKLETTKIGLEHINRPRAEKDSSGFEQLKVRAGQATNDQVSMLKFSLADPLGQTFFNPQQRMVALRENYDFLDLVEDLNIYFREPKNSKALREIVSNLVRSMSLPSRVVFIIDRVKHLETIEALAASDFFSNKRIRVIVVSRKEDLDAWSDADNRLKEIKFSKWYVPGLWDIEFDKVLFDVTAERSSARDNDWKIFLKHLQFKGRGSMGNIIEELRHGRNINFGEHTNFIDVENLARRVDIQHNAWLQNLLDMNWDTLQGDQFVGVDQEEKTDRARIAIYYLLDWLSRKSRFTKEEIIEQAQRMKISISDDPEIRAETIETLLHVLSETRYLARQGQQYKISWNKNKSPRKVARKRLAKSVHPHSEITESEGSMIDSAPPEYGPVINPDAFAAGEKVSILKRLAEALTSFVNSQVTYTPNTAKPIANESLANAGDISQKQVDTQTAITDSPVRPIVKSVHKTITEQTEYFIDKDKLMAGSIGMLIVFANPKGSDHLRLGEEDRIIRECIKRCKNRASFREKIVHAARIKDVQRELVEDEYQIVQFSGHGAPSGELVFEDEMGQLKLISQKALADLLAEFPSIQCVILNACYSCDQGKMISLGIPFTIAMDKAISDNASQSFTRGFYDALGAGKDYRFAYRMGCKAISLEGYAEETTPVLLERPS